MDDNLIAVLIFFVGLITSLALVLFIYISHFKLQRLAKKDTEKVFESGQVRRES